MVACAFVVFIVLLPPIMTVALCYHGLQHKVALFLLALFIAAFTGFTADAPCAISKGKVVLGGVVLATAVVLSLTLRAARSGHDNFLSHLALASVCESVKLEQSMRKGRREL